MPSCSARPCARNSRSAAARRGIETPSSTWQVAEWPRLGRKRAVDPLADGIDSDIIESQAQSLPPVDLMLEGDPLVVSEHVRFWMRGGRWLRGRPAVTPLRDLVDAREQTRDSGRTRTRLRESSRVPCLRTYGDRAARVRVRGARQEAEAACVLVRKLCATAIGRREATERSKRCHQGRRRSECRHPLSHDFAPSASLVRSEQSRPILGRHAGEC